MDQSRQKNDVKRASRHLKNEDGQSVMLVSMVILSFMMFFMFTLNTGILINAKISVQAAADAAAYAGAATQARQLNAISFLNYDMRRQYKKYIFRNVFVGSMASPNFPQNANPGPHYDFPRLSFLNSSAGSMMSVKVPVVCIPLTARGKPNDNCTFVNQRDTSYDVEQSLGIVGGAVASMSSITTALLDSIKSIQDTQQKLCQGQSDANLFVAFQWLFRGNVSDAALADMFSGLVQKLTPAEQTEIVQTVKALVQGLGIYPRNIISYLRILTLQKMINTEPITHMTLADMANWEKGGGPKGGSEMYERSSLALKSALANLNTSIFDIDLTSVEEMSKIDGLKVDPVTVDFNTYIQMTHNPNAGDTVPKGIHCAAEIYAFPSLGVPVGVRWTPNKVIAYGARVHAFVKPHGLMFLPGSDSLELQAVASAKPFGSRIGKREVDPLSEYTMAQTPEPMNGGIIDLSKSGSAQNYVPNMKIGDGADMYTPEFLSELTNRAKQSGTFSFDGIIDAQNHAMAPNPEEVGYYNILPPLNVDSSGNLKSGPGGTPLYYNEFIPYAGLGKDSVYRFYAPVTLQSAGDPKSDIEQRLNSVFPTTTEVGKNNFGVSMADLREQVTRAILRYVQNDLPAGLGENGESTTFAAINLPMNAKLPPDYAPLTPTLNGKKYWLTQPQEVLTSWGPDYARSSFNYQPSSGRTTAEGTLGFAPRFGFSVKFVAMRELISPKGDLKSEINDLGSITH